MIIDLLFMGGGGNDPSISPAQLSFEKKNIDANGDEIVINRRISGINASLVYWKEPSPVHQG